MDTPTTTRHALLEALFDKANDPMLVCELSEADQPGRLIAVNEALVRLTGYERDELLRMTLRDLVDATIDLDQRIATIRSTGPLLTDSVYVGKGGERLPVEVHAQLIELGGQAFGMAVARDLGRRQKMIRQQRMLDDASKLLAESIEYQVTLTSLAKLLVPDLADWCVIDLVEPDGKLDPVVVMHSQAAKIELARQMRQRYPAKVGDSAGAPAVVSTGRSELYPTVSDELLQQVAHDPDHLEALRTLGLRSGVIVPLVARGRRLGAMSLISDTAHYYSKDDLPFLEELGRRSGLAVDNARLYQSAQREITERKHTQGALRQSEERLRLILDSATDYAIFTTDLENRITSWNIGAERILGYQAHEIVGETVAVIFNAEDQEADAPAHEMHQARTRGRAEDERWHVRKDGSLFWASGLMMPLQDSEDRVIGYLKIMRDQTQAKRAQEQLEMRARQQRAVAQLGHRALQAEGLSALMNAAAKLVVQTLGTDRAGVLRWLPDQDQLRLEAGFGWPEEMVGHATVGADGSSQAGYTLDVQEPVIVEDLRQEQRFTPSSLLLKQGIISGMSVSVAGEAGHTYGVLSTHTRHRRRFTDDEVNFLQAIANILGAAIQRQAVADQLSQLNETLELRVTQRTEQLRAMAVQLSEAEERERRRLAQVLHDHLQQLLVACRLQAASMKNRLETPELPSMLERMDDLLGQAIDASRSLTVELSPPVLYDQGLSAALKWLSHRKQDLHDLTVTLDIEQDTEPAEQNIRVLLFQAVRELLLNTVKHADAKAAHLHMTRDTPDRLRITVEDQGKGFDAAAALAPSAGNEGYGLLSIRERLELIGGHMHINSQPGKGTSITLSVPSRAAATVDE